MSLRLSRRTLLGVGLALSAAQWRPAFAAAPVVTLHGDRLYVDNSGAAKPYRPPAGFGFIYSPEALAARIYS